MCLYLLGYNSNCGVQLCSYLVAVGRFLTSAHANPQRLPSEPQEGAAGIEEIQSQFPSAVASFADNKSAQQPGETNHCVASTISHTSIFIAHAKQAQSESSKARKSI